MSKIDKLSRNTRVFLEDSFRVAFIKEAIKKAGSMRQLGRIMGYTSNAPNWSIKRILDGKQGIPLFRLQRLCEFMNVSLTDIKNFLLIET
jgi:DNA-binding Xre family transcriptional regulator